MIAPLTLSPKLQQLQREAALNSRVQVSNFGITKRPAQEFRATISRLSHPDLPGIVPIPIDYGWSSKMRRTLFYRFQEDPVGPDGFLKWAQSEEVALIQERHTGRPCFVIAVLSNEQNVYRYGSAMQKINQLYIGVVSSASVELYHALLSARGISAFQRQKTEKQSIE